MTNPIDRLQQDHANFARLLKVLDSALARVEAFEHEDGEVMRDVMHYITRYSDQIHHPTEDLVYARLADKSPAAREQLAEVPRDHEALANESRALSDIFERIVDGDLVERQVVINEGRHFVEHLRKHMLLEEQHLFPAARNVLDDEDLGEVEQILQDSRDPIFGDVVDDDFKDLLEHIRRESTDL